MKTDIANSDLYNMIQFLRNNAGLAANQTLRPELRSSFPELAEMAERAARGDREVLGIPDAWTLRFWMVEMGRPNVEVVEGEHEPSIVKEGERVTESDASGGNKKID